jgi:ABC-2 type transport system ATP-binding protein
VQWIRGLFRRLAADGRTVFVSSHFMSEVEHLADHLVVIGRGRLIADESLSDFARRVALAEVTVRTPDSARLAAALTAVGATVTPGANGALLVLGAAAETIGRVVLDQGVLLHQLYAEPPSLEEAFLELTAKSVDYTTGETR